MNEYRRVVVTGLGAITPIANNVKDTWRKRFIQERKNSYEVDADILMHPRVW